MTQSLTSCRLLVVLDWRTSSRRALIIALHSSLHSRRFFPTVWCRTASACRAAPSLCAVLFASSSSSASASRMAAGALFGRAQAQTSQSTARAAARRLDESSFLAAAGPRPCMCVCVPCAQALRLQSVGAVPVHPDASGRAGRRHHDEPRHVWQSAEAAHQDGAYRCTHGASHLDHGALRVVDPGPQDRRDWDHRRRRSRE